MTRAAILSVVAGAVFAGAAFAVEPDEVLADPALEARARALDAQLRCVVCQSQSIGDSDAPLAKDMRILVRDRLSAGDTDAETMAYLVDRYGDYVLLRPPVQTNTLALWLFPAMILIGGAATAAFFVRQAHKPAAAPGPLTSVDAAEADRIAKDRG